MMTRRLKTIYGIITALLMGACSNIDESERLVYVEPAHVARAVLIEDFTGQRCVNCPNAVAEIERLEEAYGEENIIAVGIHSGPLSLFSTDKVKGLRTELGDTYYDYWNVEAEPSGLVDRRGGVMMLNQWAAQVYNELQLSAPVQLSLQCHSQSGTISIQVTAKVFSDFKGKLQLWLTEDGIVAPQMMPDGTVDTDYVHNHVFRAAVNGTWGDEVDWKAGEERTLSYTITLEEEWTDDGLSVVAFVYNDAGVQQVTKLKIK